MASEDFAPGNALPLSGFRVLEISRTVAAAYAGEGHDRDYEMVLLQDCCCALSLDEHESSIKSLQRFCRVTTSRDVVFE